MRVMAWGVEGGSSEAMTVRVIGDWERVGGDSKMRMREWDRKGLGSWLNKFIYIIGFLVI